MATDTIPDYKCSCCPQTYENTPRYVLTCDICSVHACSFECLKTHRTKCFMVDYPKKYVPYGAFG